MTEQSTQEIGHERRDVSVRGVAWFAVGLAGTCALIGVIGIGLYHFFERQHPSPDSPSRIELKAHMIAPPPQLQVDPTQDYEKFRASEDAKLNSYGWIDKQAGIVRIPIARAMDLIAQRGLPTRGDGTPDASGITPVQMQERKAAATKP